MNGKNTIAIFLIAITCLVSFSCEPGYNRDRDRSDRTEAERSLMGNWYVNGDPDKRAEIVLTAGGLEARNENGNISRLNVERAGEIRALDWEGGLRGDVSRDRIDWSNAQHGHANHLAVSPNHADKALSNAIARSWFQRSSEKRVAMSLSAVCARVVRL